MDNVLLVFPYKVDTNQDFEKLLDRFDRQGFTIHNFNNINPNAFDLNILPSIIDEVQDYHKSQINKMCVLSNIKEILLSWYRCYNSIVDDFFLFLDGKSIYYDERNELGKLLSNFCTMENETTEGKIYINLNWRNYKTIFNFLAVNNNFKYFSEIDEYDFNKPKTQKQPIIKVYRYNGQKYSFGTYSGENIKCDEISFEKKINPVIELNNEFINNIFANPYFLKYICVELYKQLPPQFNNLTFISLQNLSEDIKQKIYNDFEAYITGHGIDFHMKVYFLSLLVLLHLKQESILRHFMNALKDDNTHIKYHYPIIINTLFYISKDNINLYPEYYFDRRNALVKIKNFYGEIGFQHCSSEYVMNKRIAIVVDQLLSKNHSPTKAILDYAINLKKYYSEYSIRLFVEDNFAFSESEVIIPYGYSSTVSHNLRVEHISYINNEAIEVYYSEPSKGKKERLKLFLDEIKNYNPEIIITTSDISVARTFLFPCYPIIFISHGAINYTTPADIYLHGSKEDVLEDNKKYRLLDVDRVGEINWGLDLPKPQKIFSRKDIGLKNDDFVFITVGNRLDAEMDICFIDLVCSFLSENKKSKWLIVGPAKLQRLEQKCKFFLNDIIIRINYENDLPGLYGICDVYLNPDRKGGGYSIAIAMNENLPIVILNNQSDGLIYVGNENGAGDTWSEYLNEMKRLFNDQSYRENKGLLMKRRIETFNLQNSVNQLIGYFDLAKESFYNRTKKNI